MRRRFRLVALLVVAAAIAATVVIVRPRSARDACESLPTVVPFGRIGFRVDENSTPRCALLAATDHARQVGMQARSSFKGYDAMVFTFPVDSTASFINHFVPIDLSIGWYDAAGGLVDHATMPACPTGKNCPLYSSRRPFRFAVETPRGGLAALGLTRRGATLHLANAATPLR